MRGGAQAHLVEANGEFYVVKSTNNPQHSRTLINEWLCASILRYLNILVPDSVLIEITSEFVARHSDFYISLGSGREPIPPGLHFGSRMSVDPDRTAIFDFLPEKLLRKVTNREDFLGMVVFDKWVGNTDSRQAVFFRSRLQRSSVSRYERGVNFWAQMIDHGHAFNGAQWNFVDSPLQGLYFRTCVYDQVTQLDSFAPWIERALNMPSEILEAARRQIPCGWIHHGDDVELQRMIEVLLRRRSRLCDLILDVHRHQPSAFPNWRPSFACNAPVQ
jgi:hypothetical protein